MKFNLKTIFQNRVLISFPLSTVFSYYYLIKRCHSVWVNGLMGQKSIFFSGQISKWNVLCLKLFAPISQMIENCRNGREQRKKFQLDGKQCILLCNQQFFLSNCWFFISFSVLFKKFDIAKLHYSFDFSFLSVFFGKELERWNIIFLPHILFYFFVWLE